MIVWSYAIVVLRAISQPPTVDISFGLVTGPWNSTLDGTGMWESFTTCPCRAGCSPTMKNGASAGDINPSDWLGRIEMCNDRDGVGEAKRIAEIGRSSGVVSASPR